MSQLIVEIWDKKSDWNELLTAEEALKVAPELNKSIWVVARVNGNVRQHQLISHLKELFGTDKTDQELCDLWKEQIIKDMSQ